MSAIAPGTPCYLIELTERPEFAGRVVEVVGPVPTPEGETGQWYEIVGPWLCVAFPKREALAPRRNLLPITPPETERTAPPQVVEKV